MTRPITNPAESHSRTGFLNPRSLLAVFSSSINFVMANSSQGSFPLSVSACSQGMQELSAISDHRPNIERRASFFPQQAIHHPTPANVRPRRTQMLKDIDVRTARLLQRV